LLKPLLQSLADLRCLRVLWGLELLLFVPITEDFSTHRASRTLLYRLLRESEELADFFLLFRFFFGIFLA
jgi:hypothetical protein